MKKYLSVQFNIFCTFKSKELLWPGFISNKFFIHSSSLSACSSINYMRNPGLFVVSVGRARELSKRYQCLTCLFDKCYLVDCHCSPIFTAPPAFLRQLVLWPCTWLHGYNSVKTFLRGKLLVVPLKESWIIFWHIPSRKSRVDKSPLFPVSAWANSAEKQQVIIWVQTKRVSIPPCDQVSGVDGKWWMNTCNSNIST